MAPVPQSPWSGRELGSKREQTHMIMVCDVARKGQEKAGPGWGLALGG